MLIDVGHGTADTLRHHTPWNSSERLFQQRGEGCVGMDVTTEYQPHVRCHIIFLVEGFHHRQLRVLQTFRRTEYRIGVGLILEDGAEDLLYGISSKVGCAVLFLIHVFQLTLESTEDGMEQPFGVQDAPLLDILRKEGVVIVSHVVTGRRIQSTAAIERDETTELIGYHIVGSLEAQRIDVLLYLVSFRIVLGSAELVVLCGDGVEPGLFRRIVYCAHAVGAFEHDMLEVVGNACVRTVFGSCLHHHRTKHLGLRVVFVQPYGHPVIQGDFLDLQGLGRLRTYYARKEQRYRKNEYPFHESTYLEC